MVKYKYNPGNAEYEELRDTFTGRDEILSSIFNELKEQSKSKSNQHYLFLGPRGIGKTNLLRMIYFGIRNNEELNKNYIPIQFAEEEYSIGSLYDLFKKIIELLKSENISREFENIILEFNSGKSGEILTNKSIEFLKKYSQNQKKKVLVLIDNLDLLLGDQLNNEIEIKQLRSILMNEDFLTIIAASPTYFKEVSNYEKPFYNMFKLINLEELSFEKVVELIRKRSEFDHNTKMLEKIQTENNKLKALYHLTDGNPRLILMLYQIFSLSTLNEVNDYLQELLDDMTPYYQYKLKMLSTQQRRIIDTMARMDKAVSPTEIARELRIDVNKVNTNLKRMMDEGYVKLGRQERRKSTYYIISEKLFRIWHQMRFSLEIRKKVGFFIEFLKIWYSTDELKLEADRLMKEYSATFERRDAENILNYLKYIAYAIKDMRSNQIITKFLIDSCHETGNFDEAEAYLLENIQNLKNIGNRELLLLDYLSLSFIYLERNLIYKAITSCNKAIEINPYSSIAWTIRGMLSDKLNQYEEAIKNYNNAIKFDNKNHWAWYNRGIVQLDLKQYEEAIKSFDETIKMKKDYFGAWNGRGVAFVKLRSYQDAIISYLKGLELVKNETDYEDFFISLSECYLLFSKQNIENDNYGVAKELCNSSILYYKKLKSIENKTRFLEVLSYYFLEIILLKKYSYYNDFVDILRENKMDDELLLFDILTITNNYFQNDESAEILDRLNPEVREMVEEIIKNIKSKQDK